MKKLWCWLLLISIFKVSSGQIPELNIRQISPPGGLALEGISHITQDKYGYIWLGTRTGIFKYDSKKFTPFTHEPLDSTSLTSSYCTGILSDKNGQLWIGTTKGLNLFDRINQHFIHFRYSTEDGKPGGKSIKSITMDQAGNIWLVDNLGVGMLDTINHTFKRISHSFSKGRPDKIFFDKDNRAWLAANKGDLYTLNPYSFKLKQLCSNPNSRITALFAEGNKIWIGYDNDGIQLFNTNGQRLKHYTYPQEPTWDLKKSDIRAICKDSQGNLWFGTYNGLFREKNDRLYRFDPEIYPGLPHNSIRSLFVDQQKGIWIGTWSGGLAYSHFSDNKFINLRHNKLPYSLSNNVVSSFAQQNGKIYIGTEMGGLNEYNPETQRFNHLPLGHSQNKVINIKSLATDKHKGLWVGTYRNGLWYRAAGETDFKHFPAGIEDGQHIANSNVYSLMQSDSGIWIGTYSPNLNFYNFKTQKIHFTSSLFKGVRLKHSNIKNILLDSKNNLWIGGENGLTQISLTKNKIIKTISTLPAITDNSIIHSCELSNGNIWFGTQGNGVIIYNPELDLFTPFDANGLLKGQDVFGIIEDANKHVWLTSNNGLIAYNPEIKTFRQFLMIDGIQSNLFNNQAVFRDKDNNLYFGGTNGFTIVSPSKLKRNDRPPKALINKVTINNDYTPHHLNEEGEGEGEGRYNLNLKPNETSIKIEFTADNYLLAPKNKFKYRLIPMYDEWIDVEYEGDAVFTNLPSGEYTFELKAANNDGIWNPIPSRINIHIATPWYKTQLAYSVYVLLFITTILLIIYIINERQELKKAVLIEKIERENEEQLHEMKLKFFTNISHELRTPLTLIVGPLKRLLHAENLQIHQQELLNVINRNSDRLLNLVNQILDIRKIEKVQNQLNISSFDLIEFTKERLQSFMEEARKKELKFEFIHDSETLEIEADFEKLDKIIYNLLSNAFKYTPPKEKIEVSVNYKEKNEEIASNHLRFGKLDTDNFIEIIVLNSGSVIEQEDMLKIFNRYETGKKNTKLSTGIGLSICKEYTLLHDGEIIAQSSPDSGTQFTLRLPRKQSAQELILGEIKEAESYISGKPVLGERTVTIHDSVKNSNILVVEDNSDLREYIVTVLQPWFSIEKASNGKEALTILENHNFDLIISDVMMPEMDGFEFCKSVKSNLTTSHIPIILLTALSSTDNEITGLEKGADAYISKPFEDTLLLSQINNLLEQRRKLRESFQKHVVSGESFNAGNTENAFLAKVDGIIEKYMQDESFSVELLAREVGLSRGHLHRKLTQLTPYTPTVYINVYKLKKAAEYILKEEYTIDEIAFMTGFSSHSYFSKCFKKIYGMTPMNWKKQNIERPKP